MKKLLVYLNYVLFALVGAALLYLSFRKTNFAEIAGILQSGNYWVVIPVSLVSVFVYIARVKRWKILFEGMQIKVPEAYLFASLASGYLVNFVVPRLGEISRALILKKALNLNVNACLSTIILERLVDILCLVLILLAAFGSQLGSSNSILFTFTKGLNWFTAKNVLLLSGLLIATLFVFWQIRKRKDVVSSWLNELIQNLVQLLKIENKTSFTLYTLAIWVGFYLMTYLWFFMFESSSTLSPYDAFLVMTLGVVARSLPIQAGSAGAYHFVVSQALLLMGISLSTGNALAIVIHGFQTIVTLVLGFSAYFWLFYKARYAKN